jgi:hypothetical protein
LKPEEVIVRQHVENPDAILTKMIAKAKGNKALIARLKTVKSWPDPELKSKWILALPEPATSRLGPGCIIVVVYVTIFAGVIAGVAYYRHERREQQKCPNSGSGGGSNNNEPPEPDNP